MVTFCLKSVSRLQLKQDIAFPCFHHCTCHLVLRTPSLDRFSTFCDGEGGYIPATISGIPRISAHDKKYRWPYHAAELIEPAIDTVRAAQWTSVTDSDALVRALLKSYLHYDYPNVTLFEKGAFLADLVAGRKAYCSSLLVNAILACACVGVLSLA